MADRFPTETVIAVGFPVDPGSVSSSVLSEAGSISNRIQELKGDANALYETASSLIQDVYNFSVSDIPAVSFEVLPDQYAPFQLGASVPAPTGLFRFQDVSEVPFGPLPTLVLQAFDSSSFAAPEADPFEFPADVNLPPVLAAPSAPGDIDLNIPPAPATNLSLQPLPEVGDAPTFSGGIDVGDLDFSPIEPFPAGDLQLPDLSAFETYQSLVDNKFSRSQYSFKVLPAAITAASALVNGNFVIDLDVLEAGTAANTTRAVDKYARRVNTIWSRRGFAVNDQTQDHLDRVRQRVADEHRVDFTAAEERWRMALLPVALQLANEAHSSMVEILGELYDLDFAFLEAEAAALRSLYSLAAAKLNYEISLLEGRVAEYRGLVAQIRAGADRYRALADRAGTVGRLNDAVARGYAAGQAARESEGDVFIAQVQANESIIQAYESEIRGLEARAQALRAQVVEYDGQVAEWEGRFEAARADHRVVRAQNQAVVAKNRTAVAKMSADADQSSAVADQAAQSATQATALAAFIRGEIASREGDYAQTDYTNIVEGLKYRADVTDYRTDAALFSAGIDSDVQIYDNTGRLNSSAAATYGRIANGTVKAAELTQSNRIQLSNIFEGLYDVAGRADAARISGQLSKFRASYGLQAVGSLSYDSDVSRSTSYDDSITNDKSNTKRTVYRENTE